MHSRIQPIIPSWSNPYSAAQQARAEAAQRAGEVRRKLLNALPDGTMEVVNEAAVESQVGEGSLMVERWSAGSYQQKRDPTTRTIPVEIEGDETDQPSGPISVWA